MSIYIVLLSLHNIVRWLVLLAGVWALLSGGMGLGNAAGRSLSAFTAFMAALHLQVVLGLGLFAVQGMGGIPTFPDAPRAGFLWEHLGIGIVAAVLATLANRMARASLDITDPAQATAKWRTALILAAVAFLPILAAIPWWRPMLRLFS